MEGGFYLKGIDFCTAVQLRKADLGKGKESLGVLGCERSFLSPGREDVEDVHLALPEVGALQKGSFQDG